MRIRSTKPEFWRSERVASVSWEDRLVLKGLESFVDDNGVGKDDLALVVADVFPRDLSRNPTGTLQKVSEALHRLSEAGLLHRYEADGTRLLYISFWESIQRIEKPTKGRFRRPDGTWNYRDSEIRESSGNGPGVLRPGTGEQGNRGTGEQGKERSSDLGLVLASPSTTVDGAHDRFDEFWMAYGRKVGKGSARKAWTRAARKADPDLIIGAARAHAEWHQASRTEDRFIPHASTWLNGERWGDDLPVATTGPKSPQQQATDSLFAAAMRRAEERERNTQA